MGIFFASVAHSPVFPPPPAGMHAGTVAELENSFVSVTDSCILFEKRGRKSWREGGGDERPPSLLFFENGPHSRFVSRDARIGYRKDSTEQKQSSRADYIGLSLVLFNI